MFVTVTEPDRAERAPDYGSAWSGSVVTFRARDEAGAPVLVAVDHRMARAITEALEDGPVDVRCEPWQLVGTYLPDGAA